ncbi:MAG: hypothetical protein QXK26_02080 [Candidatus Bathyarchaeia archaeon]
MAIRDEQGTKHLKFNISDAKLFPTNTFRLCNWRWELANKLLFMKDAYEALVDKNDNFLLETIDFVAKLKEATSVSELLKLSHTYPALFKAWEIFTSQTVSFRHELEAWILADHDRGAIAERFAVHAEDIEYYENVFFDIRSRLEHVSFIHSLIVGDKHDVQLDDYTLWKLIGYSKNTKLLDFVTLGVPAILRRGASSKFLDTNFVGYAKQLLTLALAKHRLTDIRTFIRLVDVLSSLVAAEQQIGSEDENREIVDRIFDVIKNVDWSVGTTVSGYVATKTKENVVEYETDTKSLNDEELSLAECIEYNERQPELGLQQTKESNT